MSVNTVVNPSRNRENKNIQKFRQSTISWSAFSVEVMARKGTCKHVHALREASYIRSQKTHVGFKPATGIGYIYMFITHVVVVAAVALTVVVVVVYNPLGSFERKGWIKPDHRTVVTE
jgi:hypothetical protein